MKEENKRLKKEVERLKSTLVLVDKMNKDIAQKMDYDYENSTMGLTIKNALK
jgi:hypothetical protein